VRSWKSSHSCHSRSRLGLVHITAACKV